LLKVEIFEMWMLAALLISVLNYSAVGMNADVTIDLIYEFITENMLKAAVAMTCWKTAGNGCLYCSTSCAVCRLADTSQINTTTHVRSMDKHKTLIG
jgi:phage tail tube protein FII